MAEYLILVGMSGAGRSTAAATFEDRGWFVIDNLPPALIGKVAELDEPGGRGVRACVPRVRTWAATKAIAELAPEIRRLRSTGARVRVVFLDAPDEVLVRRYEGTRRRHPVEANTVLSAIQQEREMLDRAARRGAMCVVETGTLNVHELRDRLIELVDGVGAAGHADAVVSFGFKHGLPLDVDLVFDCRFLPNPHWVPGAAPPERPGRGSARLRARRRGNPGVAQPPGRPVRPVAACLRRARASPTSPSPSVARVVDIDRSCWPKRLPSGSPPRLRAGRPPPGHRTVSQGAARALKVVCAIGGGHGARPDAEGRLAGTDRDHCSGVGRRRRRFERSAAGAARHPAPGDLRRCIGRSLPTPSPLGDALEHRFVSGELAGHAFGNLLIAALASATGDFVPRCRRSGPSTRGGGTGAARHPRPCRVEGADGCRRARGAGPCEQGRGDRGCVRVPSSCGPAAGGSAGDCGRPTRSCSARGRCTRAFWRLVSPGASARRSEARAQRRLHRQPTRAGARDRRLRRRARTSRPLRAHGVVPRRRPGGRGGTSGRGDTRQRPRSVVADVGEARDLGNMTRTSSGQSCGALLANQGVLRCPR